MHVLLKMLSIQLVFLSIQSEIYSMEGLPSSALFKNTSSSSGISTSSNMNSLSYFNNLEYKNSEDLQKYNTTVNYLHNNIYDPSIFDYIRQKRKNIINIIPENEPEFVLLDLNKLCSVNKEIYDKYLNLKKKVNKSTSFINNCITNILDLENKYKHSYSTIHTRNQSNAIRKYVTNTLNNIIVNKQTLLNNMTHIVNLLIHIQSMATTYNITGCIEEYIRVSKLLLQYDRPQYKQESYIEIFNKKMEIFLQENKNLDRNDNKTVNILLTKFNKEHSQFIEKVQNRINTKKNRIDNIIQNTINKMQITNNFLFTVDKNTGLCNDLLSEITDVQSIINNDNNMLINAKTKISLNEDEQCYEQIALRELTDRERVLINKPASKLFDILNKNILFNNNDTKLISEANNIIHNIKIELGQYIK